MPVTPAEGDEWTPEGYDELFPDPADERVFRPARLIREKLFYAPTNDDFKWYVQLRSE